MHVHVLLLPAWAAAVSGAICRGGTASKGRVLLPPGHHTVTSSPTAVPLLLCLLMHVHGMPRGPTCVAAAAERQGRCQLPDPSTAVGGPFINDYRLM